VGSQFLQVVSSFRQVRHGLFVLALLLGAGAMPAKAQSYLQSIGVPPFTAQLPVENGFINAANGNLHLEIPLGSFPQRTGAPDKIVLMYDSTIWLPVYPFFWRPINVTNSWGGWRIVTSREGGFFDSGETDSGYCPAADNPYWAEYSPWIWTAPDGTQHSFDADTKAPIYPTWCPGTGTPNSSAYASDGSGFYISITNYTTATVYAPDGTKIGGGYASEDSNGNYIVQSNGWGDTLGRTVLTQGTSGSATTFTVPNAQGGTSTYTVNFATINVHTNFGVLPEYSGTITVISEVDLPDGTKYLFGYDSGTTAGNYGLISSMTLPTGGQIGYSFANFTDAYGYGSESRWISSRTTPNGSTWNYAPSVVSNCSSGYVNCQQQLTVTKPIVPPATSADQTVYTFTLNGGAWPTQVQYNDHASGLLATTTQCFSFVTVTAGSCSYSVTTGVATNVHLLAKTTTLPIPGSSNASTTTQYSWDHSNQGIYNEMTQIQEWNFGNSTANAPNRTTTIGYVSDTNANYVNTNILDRPSSVTISGGAQTLYSYDGGSLASVTGMPGHDDTNYGTGNTVRGNVTLVQQLVNGSAYLNSSATYDTTGQLLTSTDPNSAVTSLNYVCANAYPAAIHEPLLANPIQFGFDCNTGLLTQITDPNNQATGFTYDCLSRPLSTSYPDGGQTSITYNYSSGIGCAGSGSYTGATATKKINASHNLITQQNVDALRRDSTDVVTSDPLGNTTVNTLYDTNGRVQSVSNPYISTSDVTYGVTHYAYDGLDRVIKVTDQDNSAANTYYGALVSSNGGRGSQLCSGVGYPILQVDEAGKKRQTWTDGFGRVIETDEPDSSNSLTVGTCYSYDLNNNLTQVVQGSETRSYTYDMLSRLTIKTDPEPATTYFYYTTSGGTLCSGDPSAICRRTDAKGVTTTYTYDALNRLTQKSYSDGITPTANFVYDACPTGGCPSGVSPQFPVGRMVEAYTSSAKTFYSYDTMGRNAEQWQCTPINCTGSPLPLLPFTYTHNFLGQQTSLNYYGSFTISQAYDNAARVNQLTNSVSNQYNPATLVTVSQFSPIGSPTQLSYGNGLAETRSYNNRLQPTNTRVYSPPSTDVLNQTLTWTNSGQDNGNLFGWTASGSGTPTFNRTYTYDTLNRLATMSSPADPSGCTGLSWTIDTYGNRNGQNVTGGTCSAPQYTVNNKNQITNPGVGYDLDGNLNQGTYPAQYDAENRLISVNNGSVATYVYDANGHRIEKILSGGQQVHYFYDEDGHVILEVNQSGAGIKGYAYMAGQHVVEFTTQTYFIHTDHLGSTRTVTNYLGGVTDKMDYGPYGEQITGGTFTTHKFTGYERDAETGLDYAQARYYAYGGGRFMSPDPTGIFLGNTSDPQQLDLYTYVRNNPLSATDPSGLCGDFVDDSGCGGFSISIGWGWGGAGRGWDSGRQPPIYSPPGLGTSPNPSNGTLTSDDPFGGETNGIPNGLRIPTLGLPGLLMPGGPGCDFGPCQGADNFDGGSVAQGLGILCAAQPWTCELFAISVTVYGVAILAHHYGVDRAAANSLRPIFQARKRDVGQADAAWRKIQQICASVGVHLDDSHREQWHEAIHGWGHDFEGLIQTGVEMFCPQAGRY
jgi:RHS repeat-associated protein